MNRFDTDLDDDRFVFDDVTRRFAHDIDRDASRPMPPRGSKVKAIAFGAAAIVGVGSILAGAFGIAHLLDSRVTSCSGMAAEATKPFARGARRLDLVVGIAGNSPALATEAMGFVERALAASAPDAKTIVNITLVNGDRAYEVHGSSGACVGRLLLVAPAESDVVSYRKASDQSRNDVARSLERQYQDDGTRVSAAVADAIRHAPTPKSGDAGAFTVWSFVARVPAGDGVEVLDTFTVGGDNCLTTTTPTAITPSGATLIDDRVARCVGKAELGTAHAASLSLTPISALNLTGPQQDAQAVVMNALCAHASEHGCNPEPTSPEGGQQPHG